MRPLRLDISGQTDANGIASIPIKLTAGEWHLVKLAVSTTNTAEWALLTGPTAVTYGRGRRSTLGPEVIRDGERLALNVTSGPPNAAIDGSVTGASGTPEEIMALYAPQPNTIGLDIFQRPRVIAEVDAPALGSITERFDVPPDCVNIGYQILLGPGFVTITGVQTGFHYFSHIPIGFGKEATWFDGRDTQIDVTVEDLGGAGSQIKVWSWPFNITNVVFQGAESVLATRAFTTPDDWQFAVVGSFDGPVGAPSISQAVVSTEAVVVTEYLVSLVSNGGAYVGTATLQCGASVLWKDAVGVPATVGVTDRGSGSQRGQSAQGTPLTLSLNNALPANVSARLNMAGRFDSLG